MGKSGRASWQSLKDDQALVTFRWETWAFWEGGNVGRVGQYGWPAGLDGRVEPSGPREGSRG